jgi:hypothetical protein
MNPIMLNDINIAIIGIIGGYTDMVIYVYIIYLYRFFIGVNRTVNVYV